MNQWYALYCLINGGDYKEHILSLLRKEFFTEDLPLEVFLYVEGLINKGIIPTESLIFSRFAKEADSIYLDCNIDVSQYEEYINNLAKEYIQNKIKYFGEVISKKKEIDKKAFTQYTNKLLDSIELANNESNFVWMDEVIDEVVEKANAEEEITNNIKYGIESLDEHTGGMKDGNLIVISGRPSMGKSGFMGWTATYNALQGFIVPYFSLEMSPGEIGIRILAGISELEMWKFKRIKNRTEEEQNRMIRAAKDLKKIPLCIEYSAGLELNQMRSILQKIKLQKGKIDLIVVDYLQLMSGKEDNDNSRVSALSRQMKHLAIEYNCPVLLGSQLSRKCEERDNKRPQLSDLRDSGAIEQDADIVIMLYRDWYYTQNPEHIRILEVLLRKNRNGEIGKFIIDYNVKKQILKPMNFNSQLGRMAEAFKYK